MLPIVNFISIAIISKVIISIVMMSHKHNSRWTPTHLGSNVGGLAAPFLLHQEIFDKLVNEPKHQGNYSQQLYQK
jgi:hypothetical protein